MSARSTGRAADRRAEPDRGAARRDAHDALPGPHRNAAHEPEAQGCRACACSRSARTFARDDASRSRCASAASRSARRDPEQWGVPQRAGRFLRRQGRSRSAACAAVARNDGARRSRGCTRAAARACASTGRVAGGRRTASALVRHFELPSAPDRVRARSRGADATSPLPAVATGLAPAVVRRDLAIVVSENIAVGDILDVMRETEAAATSSRSTCSTSTAGTSCRTAGKALRFLCLCGILNVL